MEGAFAWASYSCCCRDGDEYEDDEKKECESCGLTKEEIKKVIHKNFSFSHHSQYMSQKQYTVRITVKTNHN